MAAAIVLHVLPASSTLGVDPIIVAGALFWLVVAAVAIWRRGDRHDERGRDDARGVPAQAHDRRSR